MDGSEGREGNQESNRTHTDLVGKSCEDRASGAAGEPEHERVLAGAALRPDEVVEEVDAVALVHLHVPVTCMNKLMIAASAMRAGSKKWNNRRIDRR